ncbi:TPA: hypothetical protein QDC20_002749 [Burkholderia aenigmatica]|uniref:hypothetical protein n=1 Tax=Burkholderia sp. AU45251 TaxID=3059204 RepID=UPI00265173BF|nr:hypothetical protein [Burkholderia sp. AU45251]HDR9482195.1 hypothetical protein [Burkholderia aenigmatica]MDN7515169.1 hypothetical protein [Burkholderia sp. AU45251]HDR9515662.1 hypothetical protein [Burkholderia aenigmatica]HDR9590566.1 hypothetical protein [Burkholderia aenigmatica]HDR9598939.1 hypothetical protein [Burkholderia aenigmatica]
MKFNDIYFSSEDRYSIGVELDSGVHYLSIPVSNGTIDYEEYYEITESQLKNFLEDKILANDFANKCRSQIMDDFLIIKPGADRGVPS